MTYEEKLDSVAGVGPATVEKIKELFPTEEDLVAALTDGSYEEKVAGVDRLGEFSTAFRETFVPEESTPDEDPPIDEPEEPTSEEDAPSDPEPPVAEDPPTVDEEPEVEEKKEKAPKEVILRSFSRNPRGEYIRSGGRSYRLLYMQEVQVPTSVLRSRDYKELARRRVIEVVREA